MRYEVDPRMRQIGLTIRHSQEPMRMMESVRRSHWGWHRPMRKCSAVGNLAGTMAARYVSADSDLNISCWAEAPDETDVEAEPDRRT